MRHSTRAGVAGLRAPPRPCQPRHTLWCTGHRTRRLASACKRAPALPWPQADACADTAGSPGREPARPRRSAHHASARGRASFSARPASVKVRQARLGTAPVQPLRSGRPGGRSRLRRAPAVRPERTAAPAPRLPASGSGRGRLRGRRGLGLGRGSGRGRRGRRGLGRLRVLLLLCRKVSVQVGVEPVLGHLGVLRRRVG